MKKKYIQLFFVSLFIVILGACSNSMSGMDHSKMDMGNDSKEQQTNDKKTEKTTDTEKITKNEFTLTAQERTHTLTDNKEVTAWTFNGSVPGPEIRVKQDETVKINLKNELPDPVTIHWHGIPVPNNMDGIPGMTMNAVQPNENFTFEFKATVPGTYWYHSHQDGVNQVDKGLYGSFIIEGKEETKYDRDYTLVLDEWMSNMDSMNMEDGEMDTESDDMEGMDHEGMDMKSEEAPTESMGHDMMSMYDTFTINGKSGSSVENLKVKRNEKVRLRLVNAGFMSQKIHLHGHKFKVISTDGQEIKNPKLLQNQVLEIAPGERYDIEFTADNPGEWLLENHGESEAASGMRTTIVYEDSKKDTNDQSNAAEDLPLFDLSNYGKQQVGEFSLEQKFDLSYTMDLNTVMSDSEEKYTINDKTFPNTERLKVKEGDSVKVKLVNNSKEDDHPMHLHGHFFQVLSKNGEPMKGSPIVKDTLNVKPGEEYEVAFIADNPGNWMFHCHDLHHASAGMVTEVNYEGYKPDFTPDPEANNKPE